MYQINKTLQNFSIFLFKIFQNFNTIKKGSFMSKIYALVDIDLLRQEKVNFQEMLYFLEQKSIPVLQYRNKNPTTSKEIEEDLKTIKKIFSGEIIINDYLDYIDFADGLHIGQEDMRQISSNPIVAISRVKEKIGSKILGLSTHNLEEIQEANSLDLDYIGLGAFRRTTTKSDALVYGKRLIDIARSSTHPVAIIGGVRLEDRFPKWIEMKVIGSDLIKKFKEEN